MPEPIILDAVRTPIAKKDGAFASIRPDELYASAINALLTRIPVEASKIGDVITGCVTQTGEQGANIGQAGSSLVESSPIGAGDDFEPNVRK